LTFCFGNVLDVMDCIRSGFKPRTDDLTSFGVCSRADSDPVFRSNFRLRERFEKTSFILKYLSVLIFKVFYFLRKVKF
jgi:hypothetical protein